MKVLITAGPTREPIDPVRFLSNYSTGSMGFALATEAARRGHEPLLVLGPTGEQPPVGVAVYAVETAREMLAAALDLLPDAGAVICAAAVSDYRPAAESERKLKRGEFDRIELIENPDIAAEIGRRRGKRPCVVFALETDDAVENARGKLENKNADLCVLNSPAAIAAEEAHFRIVRRDGTLLDLGETPKSALATTLFDELSL